MATTTPNYGWPVPTSTDYVKDGATAIEALGDAIDATVFGLGSGMNLITSQTVTTAAAINVNGCFTSTYANYKVFFNGVSSTATSLRMRMRNGTTDDSSANYDYQDLRASSSSIAATREINQTSMYLNDFATSQDSVYEITFYSPQLARNTSFFVSSGTTNSQAYIQLLTGFYDTATQFNGFSLYPASGTISGTVRVYGLEN
jgi:hypothetical protein